MIAMQYSFCLPADYDMTIIRHRVATKGARTDRYPGLVFKAYLVADRSEGPATRENLYAPFYVWEDNEGLNRFLEDPAFGFLTDSFGWPSIQTWSLWTPRSALSATLAEATWATRTVVPIEPYTNLGELRSAQSELDTVTGFNPSIWSLVQFRLGTGTPPVALVPDTQSYKVGHISLGNKFSLARERDLA